jgi:O-antigen/teichoic acid export membrane protein
MGIVAKQAGRNALSIGLGTALGALNTVVVLPAAFGGFAEGWGLVKVITAYALIFAQFAVLGAPNVLIRFSPQTDETGKKELNFFALLMTTCGAVLLAVLFYLFGDKFISLINPEDSELIVPHGGKFLLLSLALVYFQLFGGYLTSVLRSVWFTFLNEGWIKAAYLLLALAYWVDLLSFEMFVWLYVGSYGVAFAAALVSALKAGFEVRFSLPERSGKVLKYGLFSILDKGTAVVVTNLDIIMIGLMLNLENVAYYTLAFYIGSVVMIPQKALIAITGPLMSKAIAEDDRDHLKLLYQKTALHQMLVGGFIFTAIVINLSEGMSLLPDKFRDGGEVVLWIGLSKILYLLSANNPAILVYSRYYIYNFWFSLLMVGVTILTNWWLIPLRGIEGAALATAITYFFFTLNRSWFVWIKFGIHQFTRPLGEVVLLFAGLGLLLWWLPLDWHPMSVIAIKSALLSVVTLRFVRKRGLWAEVMSAIGR